jgi:hypothetical protein
MGLLSFLLKGNKGFAAANNALLAEHMLPSLTTQQKQRVQGQILHIYRAGGFPNISEDFVYTDFNSQPRLVQLNLIAMALNDLNIEPPLKGEFWNEVRNPFRPDIYDQRDMEAVQARLSNQHKIHFQVAQGPMNLMDM